MTAPGRWRSLRGLRPRLLLAFVAITVLGASAAVWTAVQQASKALADSSQSQQVTTFVSQVTAAAPSVQFPPSQESLEQLRGSAGPNSLVVYDSRESGNGLLAAGREAVPQRLRQAVQADTTAAGRVLTQRAVVDGRPWLLIGTTVMITEPDGGRRPSGIQIYTARDLSGIANDVTNLVRSAAGTLLLVLPLAVMTGLLASRSVLKPVDRLRVAARRLADGDLDARTEPVGADELAQLTRTINEMAASLQENMTAIARMEEDARRFAADVSHELRTPLTTLTASVEVLHDVLAKQTGSVADDADVGELAQLAVIETRRLVRLVEEIMEIARFDAGTAHMRWEETDVVEVVRHCLRARGWEGSVTIELSNAATVGGHGTVWADRRRLDVVMANLIGNALKHGRRPVRVAVASTAEEMSLSVTDGGDGIPDDVLPHVFSRFYKGDAARSRNPGSGLGLAIAQENARLHGATIRAANAPDAGAVFTLRLPRNQSMAAEEPQA